jgi:hypothetical protein
MFLLCTRILKNRLKTQTGALECIGVGDIKREYADMSMRLLTVCVGAAVCATVAVASPVNSLSLYTQQSRHYLLVGMGPANQTNGRPGVGHAVNVQNVELGANTNAVPSPSNPTLLNNVPALPSNARTVYVGIGGRGDIAVTHTGGHVALSNINLHAQHGVSMAASSATSTNANFSNSTFYRGATNVGGLNMAGRVNGVRTSIDQSSMTSDLASARSLINGLARVNTSGGSSLLTQAIISNTNFTFNVGSGLNVIDINPGNNDFKIQNANFVINGPADAIAIFRVASTTNFLIDKANGLLGDGGIDFGSVVFYSDRQNNNQHFNISNAVLNGVSFWSLGGKGGEINVNNAQGCTQLIADKIKLNDARLNGCGFGFDIPPDPPVIPLPTTAALAAAGMVVLGVRRRRN